MASPLWSEVVESHRKPGPTRSTSQGGSPHISHVEQHICARRHIGVSHDVLVRLPLLAPVVDTRLARGVMVHGRPALQLVAQKLVGVTQLVELPIGALEPGQDCSLDLEGL